MHRRYVLGFLLSAGSIGAISNTAFADESEEKPSPTLSIQAAYTAEGWSVVDGGLQNGNVYLDEFDLQLALDLDRAVGWQGARAFAYGLYNDGHSISARTGNIQGISNIETPVEALRLVEAWVDQSFAGDKGSLRVGLYKVDTEFDAGEVRALFLNPSHGVGPDLAQSGQNGPSIFPVASLGARLNWNFDGGIYARAAILDGVPGDPTHPKRTTIDLDSSDGALILAEVGLTNDNGRLSLGGWTYTAEFPDLVTTATHDNDWGAYASLEERLLAREEGFPFDLAGSLRFGVANEDINPLSSFIGATVVATGLIPDRADDQLGFGIAVANSGNKYRSLTAMGGGRPADREIDLELTYYADLTDWLSIQPDLQWVIAPGSDNAIDDALVAGLRLQVKKTWDYE